MLEVCKVCGCKGLWKTGIINGKQRYRCKNCNKNQAETDGREKYSAEERRCALVVYLKGGGFRRIAMIMSKLFGKYDRHQTVVNWIKKAGLKVLSVQTKQEKAEVLETDELYTYVKKRAKNKGLECC